jgi:ammonium transporter, Amt family
MRAFRRTVAAVAIGVTGAAHAQPIIVADSGDNGWMLAASIIILFAALPGASLFLGRGRGGAAGLAMFATVALATLVFASVGFSLAFSEGTAILGGIDNAMLSGLAEVQPDMTISGAIYAFFEISVALFAVGIFVGSLAERTRFGWLLVFSALWSLLVYVPVAHWLWGGGWLAGLGALDYAGGIVLQVTAGISALVVAVLTGRDRGTDIVVDTRLTMGGAALLCIGWLALIGGSSFAATGDTAEAMTNALIALSASALTGLALERLNTGSISGTGIATYAAAGLAAVSAGAGYIAPGGAILIGIIGAIGAMLAASLVRLRTLGSASAAFVINGGGAILGALLFPIFVLSAFGGPGFDDGMTLGGQIATQGIAVMAVALWAAVATAIAALMVAMVLPMTDKDEAAA